MFIAWYSGDPHERFTYLVERPFGTVRAAVLDHDRSATSSTPQLFWCEALPDERAVLFAASLVILVGMWLERFIIIVTSLHRDFLPSSWHVLSRRRGSTGDCSLGSIGFFGFCSSCSCAWCRSVADQRGEGLRHDLAANDGRTIGLPDA